MPTYSERLNAAIQRTRNPVCVGLDPVWRSLPEPVQQAAEAAGGTPTEVAARAYVSFCRRIIEVVSGLVPIVKPQVAFFEELGPAGMSGLHEVIHAARSAGLMVIADAKRGDIGNTAEMYAGAWLAGENPSAAVWGADALTVNPYLGDDALEPFVRVAHERNAGLYILVRTSNPGARALQDVADASGTVFQHAARLVAGLNEQGGGLGEWGSIGAVVGATYPRELAELRMVMPRVPLLIPGYGAQGGAASDTAAAFDAAGLGAVVNSSRGIIFAHSSEKYRDRFSPQRWDDAVQASTLDMIADLAGHTPAKALQSR
jgi:orotidine-5'-phosphate decarboxylase